ncbi:PadR family transcriptional regulator [Ferrovibrio sp.]|uniref:PadR family transcriptional regulator n=1 Tax=Ferrovibrio sp. TaxID=1917215 RepID=UPI00262B1F86|nr:PadR family transcriptional regulator [Ferrovibrio sp.]
MRPFIFNALREHAGHACMHRRGHRGGFRGKFAAFFEDDGLGGHGFRASRMVSAADLQLLILALLEQKPRHGYEIIKALEEHSSGFYAPSPGVIYPALTYLEEIGHASVTAEGAKKLYSLTETGIAYLAGHRAQADAMLGQLARIGEKVARARQFFRGGEDAADDDADASASMRAARRNLKLALLDKQDASPEEQRRIIDILVRTAKEIRGQQ